MCCCIINTEVLLANLFAKLKGAEQVSLQTIESYLNFLVDCFPVYVISDFSAASVKRCAEKYPKLC